MGWIGFDLDGTIAEDHPNGCFDPFVVGAPIPRAIRRVRQYFYLGKEIRIVTARINTKNHHTIFDGTAEEYRSKVERAIKDWCLEHIGAEFEVTCEKDYQMELLYDDRARQMERNTGRVVGE